MNPKYQKLVSKFGEHRIKFNEPLEFYTANHLPIKAEVFFIATSTDELIEIIKAAKELDIPFQLLGAGTKNNFRQNLPGLVIKNRTTNLKVSGVKGKVGWGGIGVEEALVEVDSGVSLGRLNKFLEQQNLLPLFFNSSTEATLGGALLAESQMHQFVQSVRIFDQDSLQEIEIDRLKKGQVILSAVLKIRS